MDAPLSPENGPSPEPTPEAPPRRSRPPHPRRWRGETGSAASRRGPRIAVALTLVVLAAALLYLATWLRPAPTLAFVPIWETGLDARPSPFPAVSQGDRDRLAFETPSRNALAKAVDLGPLGDGPRTVANALTALDRVAKGSETLVVHVATRACGDPLDPKVVWLLPDDAPGGLDRKTGWLPLDDLLKKVANHPALAKLLILDLHPVGPDPRLGLIVDDVAFRVGEAVRRYPTERWLVLTSAVSGERPGTSEPLGRSAFSYYLEEGLRGWADVAEPGGAPDGRVTAKELAAFVRERVGRWSKRCRGASQTPTLLADQADDFPLVILPRNGPLPHLSLATLDDRPSYPAWLLKAWTLRDAWRRDGSARDAPRVVAELEEAAGIAEHQWRGGADPARTRATLEETTARLIDRLGPLRAIPRPRAASLAMEVENGQTPDADGTAATALRALLIKRAATPPDPKPGAAEAADAGAIAGFSAAFKGNDLDLVSAVVKVASEAENPSRDTFVFLDALLKTRQPRPLYIETLTLRRLAETPKTAWRPDTASLALRVAARGARASSRPTDFATVRPLIDEAAGLRHDGEGLLRVPGYAPVDDADRLLKRAEVADDEALAGTTLLADSRRLLDESFRHLLTPDPEPGSTTDAVREQTWLDVMSEAVALLARLDQPPPSRPSEARERLAALDRLTTTLRSRLETLAAPFAADRVARLSAGETRATAETFRSIDALLATPFPDANRRAALWAKLWAVDLALMNETSRVDEADGRTLQVTTTTPVGRHADDARARRAVELLALGGVEPAVVDELRNGLNALGDGVGVAGSRTREADRAWLESLARVWLGLSERLRAEADDLKAERLGRLVPPLYTASRLDSLERSPARRLRVRDFDALRVWLAGQFAAEARDLDGSPFYAAMADEYHFRDDPLPPPDVLITADPNAPTLDPSHPSATVSLDVRLTGASAEAKPQFDVLTNGGWLDVRRGSPWPSDRSPFPEAESSPLAFDLTVDTGTPVPLPFEVRMRPDGDPASPLPPGFLVRARLGTRTYHRAVPVTLVPASRQLRIALGRDPAKPTAPVAELRLRPVRDLPPYFLHVENPTETDRKLLAQLLDGSTLIPGCEAAVTVRAKGSERVSFGAPSAKPEADLFDLNGPLRVRLLDAADPSKVLAEREVPVGVASAGDYVRVADASFEPPAASNEEVARLAFKVRAVAPVVGPPVTLDLVLTPERIPGLLSPGEGTFRTEVAAEGAEATLVAKGLRLDVRDDEAGIVDLSVDGVPRAFSYRTTFARRGGPSTPRRDDRPSVRIRATASAFTGRPYEVGLAVDNAPPGARLELVLGRYDAGTFAADRTRELPADRSSVRINPRAPGGGLRFEATVRDPSVTFDVREIRGRRELRAKLVDEGGATLAHDELPVVFDDRTPSGVTIVDPPRFALKGGRLTLRATSDAAGSGVKRVVAFAGKPVEGKIPPGVATVEGKPVDAGRTSWSIAVPVPLSASGALDWSVAFESAVGLLAFDTTTVQVVDVLPVEPGKVRGKVVEGTRAQAGLDVVVLDAKGEKGRTKTNERGEFEVGGLAPGGYRVNVFKPTPPTRGLATVTVAAGGTTEVAIEMLRTQANVR